MTVTTNINFSSKYCFQFFLLTYDLCSYYAYNNTVNTICMLSHRVILWIIFTQQYEFTKTMVVIFIGTMFPIFKKFQHIHQRVTLWLWTYPLHRAKLCTSLNLHIDSIWICYNLQWSHSTHALTLHSTQGISLHRVHSA